MKSIFLAGAKEPDTVGPLRHAQASPDEVSIINNLQSPFSPSSLEGF